MSIDWEKEARGIIRAEMVRRKISYKVLAARFEKIGAPEPEKIIANKVARAKFSAAFLFKCLFVMGVRQIDLSVLDNPEKSSGLDGIGK